MHRQYLKILFRKAAKHKEYYVINILAFTIALSSAIVIFSYIRTELSYDHFHEKADRIYRVAMERLTPNARTLRATTVEPLAETLVSEFPEIEITTRFQKIETDIKVAKTDLRFNDSRIIAADSNFLKIFDFKLIDGYANTVLDEPNSVIITKETAVKFFGDKNAIGEPIGFGDSEIDYIITGVIEPVPNNSHFHFDIIRSYSSSSDHWLFNPNYYTYLLMTEGANRSNLEIKFPEFIKKYIGSEFNAASIDFDNYLAKGNGYKYFLQPLKDIHLRSDLSGELEPNSRISFIYLLMIITIIILVVACINFINLSTAYSTYYIKEIGVRKTFGSPRRNLIIQFLTESITLSIIGFVLSIIILNFTTPFLISLLGTPFDFSLSNNLLLFIGLFCFSALLGLFAGWYPAIHLSRLKPISVIRSHNEGPTKRKFINRLVQVQLIAATVLISSTLIMYDQMDYIFNMDLGLETSQVIIIDQGAQLSGHFETFRTDLLGNPNILGIGASTSLPSKPLIRSTHGISSSEIGDDPSLFMMYVGYDFLGILGINVVQGRGFSKDFSQDQQAAILNQSAATIFSDGSVIGEKLMSFGREYEIIGVVKDFHFESLHSEVGPMAIYLESDELEYLAIKVEPENLSTTIANMEQKWNQFVDGLPFEYYFLDEGFESLYEHEKRTMKILNSFGILGILVASLGLYGLSAFLSKKRVREVAIRKVMGAEFTDILILLSENYIRIVLIAVSIGSVIAFFSTNIWLQNFAFRQDLGLSPFLKTGIMVLALVLSTVSYHSIKTANTRIQIDAI